MLGYASAFTLRWSWRITCGAWRVLKPGLAAAGRPLATLPPVAKAHERVVQPCRAYVNRHVEVWRTAWEEEKRQPLTNTPKGRELEFLLAALEVQETPASPLGRTIARTIMWLFGLALLWALIGKIDIVAIAQARSCRTAGSRRLIEYFLSPLLKGAQESIRER